MEQNQYRMYVDGNTVRKAEALPKDDRQERIRRGAVDGAGNLPDEPQCYHYRAFRRARRGAGAAGRQGSRRRFARG